MFSSPAIRIFSAENAENAVQRKPGSTVPTRKPFLDRSVNGRTPEKLQRSPYKKLKGPVIKEKEQIKEDLDCIDFVYSRKQFDDFEEDPLKMHITGGARPNFFAYCGDNYATPPPSPPFDLEVPDFFTALPDSDMGSPREFYPKPLELDFSNDDIEVDMPQHVDFDLDDFETSI